MGLPESGETRRRSKSETLVRTRPAETGGVASAMALLIAYACGVKDTGVIIALGVVVGFVPAAITWTVEVVRTARRCEDCPEERANHGGNE